MPFQPQPGQELLIHGESYQIAEHPAAPGMPHGQEGRRAVVYRLLAQDGTEVALKVFKPQFRVPLMVAVAERLEPFAVMPGLQACRRMVLTGSRDADLLRDQPDLIYAVLMPWVDGPTWQEIVLSNETLSPEGALRLAYSLARLLMTMEERGLAHTDLSGPNLIVQPSQSVALVDLEEMYGPGFIKPAVLGCGSPGYAHASATYGLWSETADRFSGAVLVAEMLGWFDPGVRQETWGESFFSPDEMQKESNRFVSLRAVLEKSWGTRVASLFSRAWRSDSLVSCPTFAEWVLAMPGRAPEPVAAGAAEPAALEPAESVRDTVRTLMGLASRFEEQGKVDSARDAYSQALALVPAGSALAAELTMIVAELDATARTKTAEHLGQLFQEGREAYEQQRWREATELLEEVVRTQPGYERDGVKASTLVAQARQSLSKRARKPPLRPAQLVAGLALVIGIGLLSLGLIGLLAGAGPLGFLRPEPTVTAAPTAPPIIPPSTLPSADPAGPSGVTSTRPPTTAPTPEPTRTATRAATLTTAPSATPDLTATAEAACTYTVELVEVRDPYSYWYVNSSPSFDLLLRNSGTCPWPADTTLVLVSDNPLGWQESWSVGSVGVGEDIVIDIQVTAPSSRQTVDIVWQLQSPDGQVIGGEITRSLRVEPWPTPTPTPIPPTATPVPYGGGILLPSELAGSLPVAAVSQEARTLSILAGLALSLCLAVGGLSSVPVRTILRLPSRSVGLPTALRAAPGSVERCPE